MPKHHRMQAEAGAHVGHGRVFTRVRCGRALIRDFRIKKVDARTVTMPSMQGNKGLSPKRDATLSPAHDGVNEPGKKPRVSSPIAPDAAPSLSGLKVRTKGASRVQGVLSQHLIADLAKVVESYLPREQAALQVEKIHTAAKKWKAPDPDFFPRYAQALRDNLQTVAYGDIDRCRAALLPPAGVSPRRAIEAEHLVDQLDGYLAAVRKDEQPSADAPGAVNLLTEAAHENRERAREVFTQSRDEIAATLTDMHREAVARGAPEAGFLMKMQQFLGAADVQTFAVAFTAFKPQWEQLTTTGSFGVALKAAALRGLPLERMLESHEHVTGQCSYITVRMVDLIKWGVAGVDRAPPVPIRLG